jgi:hypothetical protein
LFISWNRHGRRGGDSRHTNRKERVPLRRATRRLARIATALATLSLLVAVAGPAQASSATGRPSTRSATPAAVQTSSGTEAPTAKADQLTDPDGSASIEWVPVPPCVARWTGTDWRGRYVGVRNDCGTDRIWVKIYIAFGLDSPCMSLDPAQTRKYYYSGRFDGVGYC